jgi:type II secretory pathway pseudopilin PulG
MMNNKIKTKDNFKHSFKDSSKHSFRAFSLVEVTIATGLFAFVAVAILSLISVALKFQSESSLETKSFIIAEELFSNIRMSGGLKNATFRDGPALAQRNNQKVDFTRGQSLLLGYPTATTTPFGLWHSSRGQNPESLWESGNLEPWAQNNQIQTLALIKATPISRGIYHLTCQVRSPASLPLSKSKVVSFSTYFHE